MRKFLAASGVLWVSFFANSVSAQIETEVSLDQPEAPAVSANRVGNKVVLRTLDKITATTRDFTVPVGDSLTFGTLTIDVKHCEVKPPEAIPETFAFLQIFEPPQGRKAKADAENPNEPVKLFSGWMLASKPAVSALDHGVYDVWVVGCQGGEIK